MEGNVNNLEQELKEIQSRIEEIDNERLELKEKEFNISMSIIHPNIIHGEYRGYNEKIICECKICEYKWSAAPHTLLRKGRPSGCPKCVGNVAPTTEEIKKKLLLKFPNIIIISDEIKLRELMLYKFDDPDVIFSNYPSALLKDGFKNFNRYWTTDIYKNELKKVNPDIECISEFVNKKTKILHYCKIHNHEFLIDPTHALRGQGCIECKNMKIGDAHRKPLKQYLKELQQRVDSIKLSGEYNGFCKPSEHECLICGHHWYSTPQNIIKYASCPSCNRSRGETYISSFLDKMNIKYEREYRIDDCKDKRTLPFDFAIFDKNDNLIFLIEYQGRQHYIPSQFGSISLDKAMQNLQECQKRDRIKYVYCLTHNIDLLVISYEDFNLINEIITDKLVTKNMLVV